MAINNCFFCITVHGIQLMEELSYKVLNCIIKIEKMITFGAIQSLILIEHFPPGLCDAVAVCN